MDTSADEYARFRAYGNQLIDAHIGLRELLEDLREGFVPEPELGVHCLTFCAAVTRHHTAEDTSVFPTLAARHPALRDFLAELERDHQVIAGLLTRLAVASAGQVPEEVYSELDGIAAVLETHFIGEEKRLVAVLNELDLPVDLGYDGDENDGA
ncbi:hemerythrin domain-containing protein [Micromonosporaceae bacterium Da 78-11]